LSRTTQTHGATLDATKNALVGLAKSSSTVMGASKATTETPE